MPGIKNVKGRYAVEQQATPSWANKKLIKHIYGQRNLLNSLGGDKYEVDHIYPLTNNFMCGFHVETNLQIIKAKENLGKRLETIQKQRKNQKTKTRNTP